MVRPERFELPTYCLEGNCYCPAELRVQNIGGGSGIQTRDCWIMNQEMVRRVGFEPTMDFRRAIMSRVPRPLGVRRIILSSLFH